jgi:hypothetical protein
VLAALLLALAGGFHAVLPKATTSARESTATEQAAAKDAAAVQQAASQAQRQAAAAAAAQLALAKKQLASPAPGPLTTPFGTSLTVHAMREDGQVGTASLPRDPGSWPPGSGLALTDLVLMNRDGDSVDVRVLRSGVPLFVLHADTPDARTLAFGSPVVLAPADTLTVEVTCVATSDTGQPPQCAPVVYAGGFLTGGG